MFRNIWFQLHWLLGITAGVVLAVVGVTGAALSFEHDILRWMNPGIMTVSPSSSHPLSPATIIQLVQNSHPEKRIVSLTLSVDPVNAARIGFASTNGEKRGEQRYVNPYSGELLAAPQGEGFFQLMTQIHRWLAAGDVGKQIVGASTVALVILCLSGLYLRWPPRFLDWRAWFKLNFAFSGRRFIWNLHAVAGTWVLLFYLLAGLTGLYWSYEWYRSGLFALTGTPQPNIGGPPREHKQSGDPDTQQTRLIDIDLIWQKFEREAGEFSTVTLRFPEQAGQPVQIIYLDTDPAHERAFNRMSVHPGTGEIQQSERYAEKPVGAKLMSSILPLHSGSFFGLPGLVLMMLASLTMPLFTVTGWMLYLDRRKRKREVSAMRANSVMPQIMGSDPFN